MFALGLALGLAHPTAAHADGWIGTNSTDWFDPGNWGPSQVPNGSSFVFIDTRTPHEAVVGAPGAQAHGIWIGYRGNAALTIQNGGTLSSTYGGLGVGPGSTGIVTVTGPNSSWTNADLLYVTGTLLVSDGGKVTSGSGMIAVDQTFDDADIGTATVDGFGSSWTNAGKLTVGGGGTATLIVRNGGLVSNTAGVLGSDAGSQGTATIDGLNSIWANSGDLSVGSSGSGTMSIWNHGAVSNDTGYIGLKSGSTGVVTVDGAGSTWTNNGALYVATAGAGTLTVQNGGAVSNTAGWIGFNSGSIGAVTVKDPGSSWTNSENLYVGGASSAGTLTIQNGGTVHNAIGAIGYTSGSSGVATVADPGSSWVNTGALYVGQFGTGSLTARNQATLSSTNGYIGANSGSVGNAFVVGFSSWTMSGDLFIGAAGAGSLTIRSGGTVNVGGDVIIAGSAGSSGTLKIGAGSGEQALAPGTLNATSVRFGAGMGRIVFNHFSPNYVFAPQISGAGSVRVERGTTILTGDNTYTGGTTISGGILQLGNAGGIGSITGNVVNNGALAFNRSDIVTFAGDITGSGVVQQIGSGTTFLTGNNNYSGGTFVQGGTLVGNTGSISGNIGNAATVVFDQGVNASFAGDIGALNGTRGSMVKQSAGTLTLAGTSSLDWTITGGGLATAAERFGGNAAIGAGTSLTFGQTANATYAGVLSGSGSFHKTGAGLLNLSGGSSAFAGSTSVEAGTLAVNGSLGGTLEVLSGARLQGIGTVGNTIVRGTIAPGNSIGTIKVGNIGFISGSTYEVEVNAAGQSDRIAASGTATIGGGTVNVLDGQGRYTLGSHYAILTATGGVLGTFDSLTRSSPLSTPLLSFALNYDDPHAVYLDVGRSAVTFASAGQTRNQIATAGGLDSVPLTSPLINAVAQLDMASTRSAFDQLSGEVHASAKTVMIEDSRFLRNAVNDRLRAAFDGVGAPTMPVMAYGDGGPEYVPATIDRFAVWGQAFGSWGHWNSDGNAARLERSIGGLFVGADAPVFDTAANTWRFGAVAGYSRTSLNARDRHSSGASDNYHLGLYGGTQWGDLTFRTGAAHTWHDIATNRSVILPGFGDSLKGKYNAATAQIFGELAYGFNAGNARFEPFANLAYVNLQTDGFRETGGAAALTSPSANTDAPFTTLGNRAATSFNLGGAAVTARGMLGWRHAFGDVTPNTVMRFAGGDAFFIGGVPIARNAAVVEAGLDLALSSNAVLGVAYGGQFGSGATDQTFRANFNMKF